MGSDSNKAVATQRKHNSSEASSSAVPTTVTAVKGQGLMMAPAPAGGASVATRKRPTNGYLNKVG